MKVILTTPAADALDRHWDFLILAYDEAYAQQTLDLIDAVSGFLVNIRVQAGLKRNWSI